MLADEEQLMPVGHYNRSQRMVQGSGRVTSWGPLLEAVGLVIWMQSPVSVFQLPACKETNKKENDKH